MILKRKKQNKQEKLKNVKMAPLIIIYLCLNA